MLEEELGFPVFRRTYNGIALTEEGYLFLNETEKILRADKAIHSISPKENHIRLRVGIINYTPATEAFVRFCNEKKDIDSGDLICVNIGTEEGILRLTERSLDVVVSVLTNPTLQSYFKTYGLVEIPIKRESLNLIYIIRNGDKGIPSIIRYAKFLEDEVNSIM